MSYLSTYVFSESHPQKKKKVFSESDNQTIIMVEYAFFFKIKVHF